MSDELAEVYRDYCKEVWIEALNLARVPTNSEWREARNIFYPPDIREVPANLPSSPALVPLLIEQPLTTEAPLPPLEVLEDSSQVGDQEQGANKAKDKGKGKEVQAPSEAKDAVKAKDVAAKAKEVENKSKDVATAKDALVSKPGNKEDPPSSSKT